MDDRNVDDILAELLAGDGGEATGAQVRLLMPAFSQARQRSKFTFCVVGKDILMLSIWL